MVKVYAVAKSGRTIYSYFCTTCFGLKVTFKCLFVSLSWENKIGQKDEKVQ